MIPGRIPLHVGTQLLALAPDETARISLAWWEDGPEPVLVAGPHGPCTVCIRWPTSAKGRLDVDAVRRGETEALRWDLTNSQRERIASLLSQWDLRRHDLLVHGNGRVGPCPEGLRTAPLGLALDRLVEAAVARVAA